MSIEQDLAYAMVLRDLRSFLLSAGYKEYKPVSEGAFTLFQKRDPSFVPGCLSNGGVTYTIELWNLGHGIRPSATVSITGSYVMELWTKLEVYSLSWDELTQHLRTVEQDLLFAWEAMAVRRSST